MASNVSATRNRTFVLIGLGTALLIAIFLSPFASQNPDGLNRVARDQKFEHRATENPPARKLPFYQLFNEYALRGVPASIATPVAGLIGTLVTFGIAWGVGKLVVKNSGSTSEDDSSL